MTIVVDKTHLGRRASGIERVTEALFSNAALAPLEISAECSGGGRLAILLKQTFLLPVKAAARQHSIWIFPGFPPSAAFTLLKERAILYVHDTFLVTRRQDLNAASKYWSAPNFRLALNHFKYFMANSLATAEELKPFVRPDAQVIVYRPGAENVFMLAPVRTAGRRKTLIVGGIGTLEPRKNFTAAARICHKLREVTGLSVELHIIGRRGWGGEYENLVNQPHVKLHGFLSDAAARSVIETFDLLLCTSHAEGLCLPLLEAQFAGLQVVAPDQAVFREVLGGSGIFVDPCDADGAARTISNVMQAPGWRERAQSVAALNIIRWNDGARSDRRNVIAFLSRLLEETSQWRAVA